MRRRAFIAGLGAAASAWPVIGRTQQAPARIGFLASGAQASSQPLLDIIREGLQGHGLAEGRDYLLDTRYAEGRYERFPDFARELAASGARVLLANTIASVRAAQRVMPPVPVVMLAINDPVGAGLVASLAKPGGRTTGMANLNEDITPKLLEYMRAVLPQAALMAALFNPANPTNPVFVDKLGATAGAMGFRVVPFALRSRDELPEVFASLAAQRPDALQVITDSATLDLSDRISALALSHRIPAFGTSLEFAKAGGLMSYGTSRRHTFLRATYFVKKILDGVPPGELPVEQPTQLELWINLKTAAGLHVSVPNSVLALAHQVIE
jgi:putative ABC transport system substrate-binding protein